MSVADTIQSIKTHTQNAYAKIGEKGGTVPANKNLENLSSSIESIPAGGGTDMLQSRVDETKNCVYLFYYYTGTNPDCVKNLDTSNVTNMFSMFYECSKLTTLNLGSFNTSNVTSMQWMFRNCRSLTSLDLSNFNTSNVTDMSSMFEYCRSLTSLDISNFDFTNVTNYNTMFSNIPANCEILVKDETAKTWITSKFSNLTNVKVKGAV